jgi:hypothetical protein
VEIGNEKLEIEKEDMEMENEENETGKLTENKKIARQGMKDKISGRNAEASSTR